MDLSKRKGVHINMNRTSVIYEGILLLGVFISSISQVLLKKASMCHYDSPIQEYMNPLVVFAYIIFVGTTLLSIFAYRGIPLSMGPVLEATSYIYVSIFGVIIFDEKMDKRKFVALMFIICGILIYSLLG